MKTAAEYIDAIKTEHGIVSDYALAKRLGWSRARVSQYRTGLHHFDETGALQVAELLDLDPAEVLLDALASRAHSPAARAAFESARARICVMLSSRRRPGRAFLPALRIPPAYQVAAFM